MALQFILYVFAFIGFMFIMGVIGLIVIHLLAFEKNIEGINIHERESDESIN
jgi:hypothetical protein